MSDDLMDNLDDEVVEGEFDNGFIVLESEEEWREWCEDD